MSSQTKYIYIYIYIERERERERGFGIEWLIWHKIKPNQPNQIFILLKYMYNEVLALNNLQRLICYKTQPNPTKSYMFNTHV